MGLRSRIPALNDYENRMMEGQGMDSMRSPAAIDWENLQKQKDLKESADYYSKLSQDPSSVGVEEIKTDTGEGYGNMAQAAGQSLASGGGAEGALSAGLMASGNPYAIGAGLGLMALSSINKQKQEQKNREYQAKVAEINARRAAIENLARIGQSLRA